MLLLQRYANQRIVVGDNITITVTSISPGLLGGKPYVQIGIYAPPPDVPVHREEVYQRIQEGKDEA